MDGFAAVAELAVPFSQMLFGLVQAVFLQLSVNIVGIEDNGFRTIIIVPGEKIQRTVVFLDVCKKYIEKFKEPFLFSVAFVLRVGQQI